MKMFEMWKKCIAMYFYEVDEKNVSVLVQGLSY